MSVRESLSTTPYPESGLLNKPSQSLHATGPSDQAAMQANRHHFGTARNTFGVKRIKAVF